MRSKRTNTFPSEAAWAAGVRPRLEDRLDAVGPAYRAALLRDLLASELEARRRLGERPEFLPAFYENMESKTSAMIESNVVAQAILAYLSGRNTIEGTSAEWLGTLTAEQQDGVRNDTAWPKTPEALSSALRRAVPLLNGRRW